MDAIIYLGAAMNEDNNHCKSMKIWNILLDKKYIDFILICTILLSFLILLLASA